MKKYIAEFIGTLGLALIVSLSVGGGTYFLSIPIAASLFVMIMVYVIGHISGAHMNPTVTLALFLNKEIKQKQVGKYLLAQILAGISALFIVRFIYPMHINPSMPLFSQSVTGEILGAFFFLFGLSAVFYKKVSHGASGFVIGGSLLVGLIISGLVGSLAILNPAVALALGIFKPAYLLAPIIGGGIGVWAYKKLV